MKKILLFAAIKLSSIGCLAKTIGQNNGNMNGSQQPLIKVALYM
jgi:hypothetical protein